MAYRIPYERRFNPDWKGHHESQHFSKKSLQEQRFRFSHMPKSRYNAGASSRNFRRRRQAHRNSEFARNRHSHLNVHDQPPKRCLGNQAHQYPQHLPEKSQFNAIKRPYQHTELGGGNCNQHKRMRTEDPTTKHVEFKQKNTLKPCSSNAIAQLNCADDDDDDDSVVFVKEYNKNKITLEDSFIELNSDLESAEFNSKQQVIKGEHSTSHTSITGETTTSESQNCKDSLTISHLQNHKNVSNENNMAVFPEVGDSDCVILSDQEQHDAAVLEHILVPSADTTITQNNGSSANLKRSLNQDFTTIGRNAETPSSSKPPNDSVIQNKDHQNANTSCSFSQQQRAKETHPDFIPLKKARPSSESTPKCKGPPDFEQIEKLLKFDFKSFNLTSVEWQQFFQQDKLSRQIYQFMKENQQKSDFLLQKIRISKALKDAVCYTMVRQAEIYLVGSSINGFGRLTSDADLCLVIDPKSNTVKRKIVLDLLRKLKSLLHNAHFVRNLQLIFATVPILKFTDSISGMECDFNVNNLTGIRNTFLLLAYARCDPRVRPMVLCIKEWAHSNDINSAQYGTLSSYALVLMILHYLQNVKPCVIPSLQAIHEDEFTSFTKVYTMFEKISKLPVIRSENRSPVSELMKGFFKYFSQFDFVNKVISIRLGTSYHVARTADPRLWMKKCLKIEEPFDLSNVARAVQTGKNFDKIKSCIRNANIALRNENLRTIIPQL